jgi:MFS transporter, FHS family, glucose/mannose:H+ symporter
MNSCRPARYNLLMSEAAAVSRTRIPPAPAAGRALAGFLLSGFLFALLGAILPAWGYYLDPPRFAAVGTYFLGLGAGVIAATELSVRILARRSLRFLLVLACATGCGGLLALALATPPAPWLWRVLGLAVIGLSVGLLNTALFHAISSSYRSDPARTVILGGIFYGLGCLAVTLLVAGTFYVYRVASLMVLMAVVPGLFAGLYARTTLGESAPAAQPTVRQAFHDFRSLGAVLFALLLFFQFGNEWSIAGWLPLFLVRRLGISPPASLWLLALYWFALLAGRLAAVRLLPAMRHGRLLGASVLAALSGCLILALTNNRFGAAAGVLLLGCGFAAIYPLVAERIGRRFPYYHPVFFSGIFSFALFGGLIAPAMLGYAAARWGIGVVLVVPLAGTVMVSGLLLLIWLETKVTGR